MKTNDLVAESIAMIQEALSEADILPPDVVNPTYLKWDRADGGYVIFRGHMTGFGELDTRWREDDGRFNGPFCPIRYDYIPWIVRDIALLLALRNGHPTREQLRKLGKRD